MSGSVTTTETLTIELSRAIVTSAFEQMELDIVNSQIYVKSLHNLEKLAALGHTEVNVDRMIKAIAKEAVRLTLRHLAKNHQAITPSSNIAISSSELASEDHESEHTETPINEPFEYNTTQPERLSRPLGLTSAAKSSKKKQAQDVIALKRAEGLRRIGKILKQAREKKSLSLTELHYRTYIVLEQIQALEDGKADKLPEDIFIHSFLRKLAKVLDLDAQSLIDLLPETETPVIPSWYRENLLGKKQVSLPMYLGYTALVASTVGGVSWLTHEATRSTANNQEMLPSNTEVSLNQNQQQTKVNLNSSVHVSAPEIIKN